ncbi:type II toxin-antitoxin system ParD family antitoxin [Oricola sp.]|uniref:type II toxin-antitoxin system ParD family antitoxin n=1 Tax=Oricola sp. TaxID=1979950 RepID=UPI0025EF7C13|nr:type II toxin-antitoxin system ParD family antitoxin [Oricola sp.]MCI5077609.1 type II toxin-antitoxin system ParD family antitoxin [Oricola sp.]
MSLGKAWERYVAEQVESGLFNNASEVVRDALRRQQEHLIKLEALQADLRRGRESVEAGRVSRAGPEDIIEKAKSRKPAA